MNGRLFTAKELQEIEDRVYASANIKLNFMGHKKAVNASMADIDKVGLLRKRNKSQV